MQGVRLLLLHLLLLLLLLPSFLGEGWGLGKGFLESPPVSPCHCPAGLDLFFCPHTLHPPLSLPKPGPPFWYPSV